MRIKRVEPSPCAKLAALLYAAFGAIVGLAVTLGSIAERLLSTKPVSPSWFVAAVIALPAVYGVVGWFSGWLFAWLYNAVAAKVGGLELQIES